MIRRFFSARSVAVLYGSQTGTAQAMAHGLHMALAERDIQSSLKSLDDAVPLDPNEPTVIVISNFGVGEPPDNARKFWQHYVGGESTAAADLSSLRFALFGLGNKTYGGNYQHTGRCIDERLGRLGAQRLVARGEGDSSNMHDPEDDFEAWCTGLLDALDKLPADDAPTAAAAAAPALPDDVFAVLPLTHLARRATVVNGGRAVLIDLPPSRPVHGAGDAPLASATRPVRARVVDHRELHHLASPRSCAHVAFDVTEEGADRFVYETGDYVGVFAENSAEDVELALSGLRHARGLDRQFTSAVLAAGAMVTATPAAAAIAAPHARFPTTLDSMLRFYVDLSRPAPRRLLRLLSLNAGTASERASLDALVDLARPRGDAVAADVHAISTAGVLARVTHSLLARLSIAQLLAHMNPLAARFFSISSAASVHPGEAWVAAGRAVHWDAARTTAFSGCASRWLGRLRPGDTAAVFPVASNFRLLQLATDEQPIVMIANGSGMAPFRAFAEERVARGATGATVLLYGCIDADHFLYREDFESWRSAVEVHAVFSHAEPGAPLQFVQHRLRVGDAVGERIWELVHERLARVFLCGTPLMGEGVTDALNVMARAKGFVGGDYAAWLREQGRFHREVFK